MFYTYILYSEILNKFYKGHTINIKNRLKQHNTGKVLSTLKGIPWRLVLTIEKPTRSDAIILENKLKNLNRERLLLFIEKYKK